MKGLDFLKQTWKFTWNVYRYSQNDYLSWTEQAFSLNPDMLYQTENTNKTVTLETMLTLVSI